MNKHEYAIRLATKDDIGEISKLYIDSWQRTYKGLLRQEYLDSLTMENVSHRWGEHITQPNHGIFVAVAKNSQANELLGFGAFKPYHRIDDCIYIESLHVKPSFHGMGIGTALITEIRQVGTAGGYGQMAVCYVKGNDKAADLYLKLGASHYRDKVDDFTGEISYSEILTWDL